MITLNQQQVRKIMADNEVLAEDALIADEVYALPTVEWLRNDFAPALKRFYEQLGIGVYRAERNDCDNFARGASFFADVLHNRMNTEGIALLFGEYWYQKADGRSGHAINCTIVAGQVVFFEPQNVLFNQEPMVRLAREERLMCRAYRY